MVLFYFAIAPDAAAIAVTAGDNGNKMRSNDIESLKTSAHICRSSRVIVLEGASDWMMM